MSRIENPEVFPECCGCPFATQAGEIAKRIFPQADVITQKCRPTPAGGATQINGKFTEFTSRKITLTPNIPGENIKEERAESFVPKCPHEIPGAGENQSHTIITHYYTDPFGHAWSNSYS